MRTIPPSLNRLGELVASALAQWPRCLLLCGPCVCLPCLSLSPSSCHRFCSLLLCVSVCTAVGVGVVEWTTGNALERLRPPPTAAALRLRSETPLHSTRLDSTRLPHSPGSTGGAAIDWSSLSSASDWIRSASVGVTAEPSVCRRGRERRRERATRWGSSLHVPTHHCLPTSGVVC